MRRTIHRVFLDRVSHTWRGARGKRKSICHGTAQVVLWVGVVPRKMRTCQPEDVLDLFCEHAPGQQLPGDPQIDNAPVRLSESLSDAPSVHPALVDLHGRCRLDAEWGCRKPSCDEIRLAVRDRLTRGYWRVPSRLQQGIGVARQTSMGVHDFHPGSVTTNGASLGLLIGEPSQSSQVTQSVLVGSPP